MKQSLFVSAIAVAMLTGARAQADDVGVLLRFSSMYGVDGPFLGDEHPIRGVAGDDLPWKIRHVEGTLLTNGSISIQIQGLVFPNDPMVPPNLRGINDEKKFRAIVSCLSEDGDDVAEKNVATGGFAASRSGNSQISARLSLPNPCVAPIVFIVAADEDDWLAVTGVERERVR